MKLKKINLSVRFVFFTAFLCLCLFPHDVLSKHYANKDKADAAQTPCQWRFAGHLGQVIDRVAEGRIINRDNWNKIYPETEEAFRLREGDKNYPNRGVWDGEFWGKYILSAIAACRYYQSDELKSRIAGAVKGLLSAQDEDGYLGTYAHPDFVKGNTWHVWNQKYTLWALVEAWNLLRDDSILAAAKRMTDHLISKVGPGPEAVNIGETGGFHGLASTSILQPMVKLYKATGDVKYLEYAEYIVKQWSEQPDGIPDILNKGLSGEPVHNWFPDTNPRKWDKAYEFMSCVEGLLELYEVTGKKQYLEAAANIHAAIVKWERTPIGSVDFNEHFVGTASLINTLSAVCDVVYWNRLSYKLFAITGDERYMDEFERTLYNSLLSSFHSDGSWGLRRIRMSHIHIPAPNHWLQHHQCCVTNVPRGLFQAAEAALTTRNDKVYLSLFNEGKGSVVLPSGQLANIEINGDFLEQSGTKITLSLDQPEEFSFLIRMPRWSDKTEIKVNGRKHNGNESDRWMTINRVWKDGDRIEITFDMNVRWEVFDPDAISKTNRGNLYEKAWAATRFAGASNEDLVRRYNHIKSLSLDDALPNKPAVAFFYGPIALARDARVTDGDIFAPIPFSGERNSSITIQPIKAPPGIWKAYELNLGHGKKIKLCDFSSAGNTWDDGSRFNTWCILKKE